MKRTISEKKVLKKLGISDFRHMTKDKVVKFASMLPYMDPEVAKKALEQFPAFKDLARNIVVELKGVVEKAFTENNESQNVFYDICKSEIVSLQEELKLETLTSEDRDRIENKMIRIAEMVGEKDSENKKFLLKIIGLAGSAFVALGLGAASILGSNTQMLQNDDDELDEDREEAENGDDVIEI